MMEAVHRVVKTNGIDMHIAEQAELGISSDRDRPGATPLRRFVPCRVAAA